MTESLSWKVDAICAGPAALMPNGKPSAIAKQALAGPVEIGPRGIVTDEQVDRRHHGFAAMALHQYPAETYPWLRHHFGDLPRLYGPGSMGENISATGLTEHDVCIGDRFRLGTAMIELSQPRQPCSTIEQHLERKGLVKALVASARCGWFYRVLEPGTAQAGDSLERIERGHTGWSVARAFLATYGAFRASDAELEELAQLPRVSDRLVRDIAKRMAR